MTDLKEQTRNERILAARPEEWFHYDWHVYGELKYQPLDECGQPLSLDDDCWVYRPAEGTLVVDGVTYIERGQYCERPMVQIFDDIIDATGARMRYDKPPTEAELDAWVHNECVSDDWGDI